MSDIDDIWQVIRDEAKEAIDREPALEDLYQQTILQRTNLSEVLSFHLASKLSSSGLPCNKLYSMFIEMMQLDSDILYSAVADMSAHRERDPACDRYTMALLYFKGFHAIQAYRISHALWKMNRQSLALFIQNRIAEVFDVDIHPAAKVGKGIMLDHATGVVIGETCVIGDNVSMLHSVTLGGCGNQEGDRHPKIGNGVLISAGAKILGNIKIGDGAKVGAGSLVLEAVPAHTTVVGVPARAVGRPQEDVPALEMDHQI